MDDFAQWLMGAVVHSFFVSDQFVATRYGHIDTAPIRIPLVMGMIGLLDCHVATIYVVAKSFQTRRVIQNEVVNLL